MKLYKIWQDENDDYDTYDSAVVCCEDIAEAESMNPDTGKPMTDEDWHDPWPCWASSPINVNVQYLGKADPTVPKGVICSSFNAG